MSLTDLVLAAIRKHGMAPRGGRLLVALSGGPDSVGLLHLLRELESRGEVLLAGAAHLNHGLRPEADEDEAFCRAHCLELGVPFFSERADVAALASVWHTSVEDAGRRARYAYLDRTAAVVQADGVATGHTRDDQAETFLLQLIRGAGPRGLGGIHPRRGLVCRPLIEVRRAAVVEWLRSRGVPFRTDASNSDLAFTRNRVRHRLLPLLERDFSPGIVEVLAREAAIARFDEDRLHAEAIEVAGSVVLRRGSRVEIDAVALTSLHPALAGRVARIALAILAPDRHVGFDHVERLLALAGGTGPSAASLPGQQARRAGELVTLQRPQPAAFANFFCVPLSVPGEVVLAQGWAVSSALASVGTARPDEPPGALTASVPLAGVSLPLRVRSRRRGDGLRPAGMQGRRKKLQDLFVDRKVPRELRDTVPLVVDSDDRILWVVGQAVAEEIRSTTASEGVLFLKARRLGGLG
jgi:tRNA(Ile)-lysidine synthase